MEKLQFEFVVKAGEDGKSNIFTITSISTEEGKTFKMPEELQYAGLHKQILNTEAFRKIKNSLKKRHQTRKVWIKLTQELKDTYIDEGGNVQFADHFLEEVTGEKPSKTDESNPDNLTEILKKLIETKQTSSQNLSVKNITEKFVLEKFTNKNSNAKQWIETFEKECERFEIKEDERKIEIFRLFLDKSCLDWYSSMLIKLTLDSEWINWKNKFCETYANKGWNPIIYALSFTYKNGSLLDYAIKKERLLLEIRKFDAETAIDLIATGLPKFILNRIDRESLKEIEDLFNEINKYEHLVNKKILEKKDNTNPEYKGRSERQKCKICERLNKGQRFHSESVCWFRTKEEEKEKRKNINFVNNSEIEAEINDTDQKN